MGRGAAEANFTQSRRQLISLGFHLHCWFFMFHDGEPSHISSFDGSFYIFVLPFMLLSLLFIISSFTSPSRISSIVFPDYSDTTLYVCSECSNYCAQSHFPYLGPLGRIGKVIKSPALRARYLNEISYFSECACRQSIWEVSTPLCFSSQ